MPKQLPTPKQLKQRHKKFKKDVAEKLLPRTKIKSYFKTLGIRAEGDLHVGLADEVYRIMLHAALRTLKNNRKTVRKWDF